MKRQYHDFLLLPTVVGLVLILPQLGQAQTVIGMGTESPNPNAVLELVPAQGNQGFLAPRLTRAQRTASSFTGKLGRAENGLLVFDVDEGQFFYWYEDQWHRGGANRPGGGNPVLDGAGTTWYTGTTAPNGISASEGDFYLDESTGEVYKFSNDAFVVIGSLQAESSPTTPDLSTVLQQENSAGDQKITNLGEPTEEKDAATKAYVDTEINNITLSSALTPGLRSVLTKDNNADNRKITGLIDPDGPNDAANKQYVDGKNRISQVSFTSGNNKLVITEDGTQHEVDLTELEDEGAPATLPEGAIYRGDSDSKPQPVTIQGDIEIAANGTVTIKDAVITARTINADVAGPGLTQADNGSLQVKVGNGLIIAGDEVKVAPFPAGWIGIGQGDANDMDFKKVTRDAALDKNGEVTVTGLQGRSVSSTAPADGQLLIWEDNNNGGEWKPVDANELPGNGGGGNTPKVLTGNGDPGNGQGNKGDTYIKDDGTVFMKIKDNGSNRWARIPKTMFGSVEPSGGNQGDIYIRNDEDGTVYIRGSKGWVEVGD